MNVSRLIVVLVLMQPAVGLLSQQPDVWIHSHADRLPTDKLGPFVHTSDGNVLAIDSDATFTSSDGGQTWSDPRPLTGAIEKNFKVSNERAMMRTKNGTIIAAFMNLNERKWTWQNELFDAPGAKLPTWVMRSEDDGKTWSDRVVIARSQIPPESKQSRWIAIDEVTLQNGCLWVIPGSHLGPVHDHSEPSDLGGRVDMRVPEEMIDRASEIPITLSAGSCSFHHSKLLHRSGPNQTKHHRRGLAIHYMSARSRWTDLNAVKPSYRLLRGNNHQGCV